MPEQITVITFPQPTANGPLHVGHLSGPYVAADIAARAARARGERVLVSSGLDIHQNYVLVRAQNEGVEVEPMMADFRNDIRETYRRAGIGYDAFTDPLRPDHDATIADMITTLVERGRLPMREVTLYRCERCDRTLHHAYVVGRCGWCREPAAHGACEACGAFTSPDNMVDPTCARCGDEPTPMRATVPVLSMAEHTRALTAMWLRADLPAKVRRLIGHHLREGLPEIPVAYPTNWGIEGTGPLAGLRIDPYAEVALTDLYGIARALEPDAATLDEFVAAWRPVSLWNFFGIDNAFWYAVFWPAMWAAAGMDRLPQSGMVTNEFYTLDGKKFSTSRNHAIWANEILADEDPAIVRLYLAWDRPDRYPSDFTRESFAAFRDRVAPLLAGQENGAATNGRLPAELAAAERARGETALRLTNFDPSLAVRSLLTLLAGGVRDTGALGLALTGTDGG